MKKLIVALFAVGIAGSSMAGRYMVYDVRMSGSGIDVLEDKGKVTIDGETERIDKYVKDSGTLRGYLIEDEYQDWFTFLLVEKGSYTQGAADLNEEIGEEYLIKERFKESIVKYSEKGTVSARFYAELGDSEDEDYMTFNCNVIGKYMESGTWNEEIGEEETSKFSLTATGAGTGAEYVDEKIGVAYCVYFKSVKMKYNRKLSAAMSDAYDDEDGEDEGIEAAEDVLNEFVNKKARIDDAGVNLLHML